MIFLKHLPPLEGEAGPAGPGDQTPAAAPDSEEAAIRQALTACRGNRGQAAALLGLSRTSLWRKMKQLGL